MRQLPEAARLLEPGHHASKVGRGRARRPALVPPLVKIRKKKEEKKRKKKWKEANKKTNGSEAAEDSTENKKRSRSFSFRLFPLRVAPMEV